MTQKLKQQHTNILCAHTSNVQQPYGTHTLNDKVEMIQRRAAHYVLNRYRNIYSVFDMLAELNWESLEHPAERRTETDDAVPYKIRNNIVAMYEHQYLTRNNCTSCHTNYSHSYTIPHSKTDYHCFSFPRTARIWNTLPNCVIEAETSDAFHE